MFKEVEIKRWFVSILVWFTALGFLFADVAYASVQANFGMPLYLADVAAQPEKDLLAQLETEVLPQIEKIFTPEQLEQFQTNIADGMTFRKAFKSLMLTPEQKTQLKTVLRSALKKDALASLTPEQKTKLFAKKKEMFKPTTEELTEKIETSLKEKGVELPAGVKEKIDAGLKRKDSFIPSPETIVEKIETGMSAIKEKF